MSNSDFYDNDRIHNVFYKECEESIKKALGATKVVIFDHIVRNFAKMQSKERLKNGVECKMVCRGVIP
jgi:hypothetical protein